VRCPCLSHFVYLYMHSRATYHTQHVTPFLVLFHNHMIGIYPPLLGISPLRDILHPLRHSLPLYVCHFEMRCTLRTSTLADVRHSSLLYRYSHSVQASFGDIYVDRVYFCKPWLKSMLSGKEISNQLWALGRIQKVDRCPSRFWSFYILVQKVVI
jgi:hypothetical protein